MSRISESDQVRAVRAAIATVESKHFRRIRQLSSGVQHEFSDLISYLVGFMDNFADRREIDSLLFFPRLSIKEGGPTIIVHPRKEFAKLGLMDETFGWLFIEQVLEKNVEETIQELWSNLRLSSARNVVVIDNTKTDVGGLDAIVATALRPLANLVGADENNYRSFNAVFVCHLVSCPFTNCIPASALDCFSGLLFGFMTTTKLRGTDLIASYLSEDLGNLASNISGHFDRQKNSETFKTVLVDYEGNYVKFI